MPSAKEDFQRTLNEAVEDMLENGFDSAERVERWVRLLRETARRALVSEESLDHLLKERLASVYRRMVERDGALRYNPGVERFTYERIKPKLRGELDRRIMASANLIRLNRDQAIEKTLQRFTGWSTSIPRGGVSRETKVAVKKDVKKALASLPFEERRVLIDQGHKLVASINDVIATDGGAIAARWRSNWRQPGYDYREPHKELDVDGKLFLIKDSWAQRAGLVKPGKVGYAGDVVQPGQLIFCRCYWVYVYSLSEMSADMLTAKGKAALASALGQEEVRAARSRGDAAGKATKAEAGYVEPGEKRPRGLQCNICSMYRAPASCTAVEGDVSPAGWCTFFEFSERMARDENAGMKLRAAFMVAEKLDKLGYLRGVRRIENVSDRDRWHASYDAKHDQITLEKKLERLDQVQQVRVILHEAGHRGQMLRNVEAFDDFKRRGLDTVDNFLEMANGTHVEDYEETGQVSDMPGEVFAESYSRACLGLPMPAAVREFWAGRLEKRRDAA